jgi:hypothetical protein
MWTPVPRPVPQGYLTLKFQDVDPVQAARISSVQTFHLTGCAGDFSDQTAETAVARAMSAQVDDPDGAVKVPGSPATHASFLFHLGDVVYKDKDKLDPEGKDQVRMYNDQFYEPYTTYRRTIDGRADFNCIFAIAGNHDGKASPDPEESAIDHFLANFCAAPVPAPAPAAGGQPMLSRPTSPDNRTDARPAMIQPHVYWRLSTPLAYVIGLYTNVANGGILDDPSNRGQQPQYDWFVEQLQHIKAKNASNSPRKAVLVALHYPPYSGTTNFMERGDPTVPHQIDVPPVGKWLQQAFKESGLLPDLVVSAHAHLYQRLTYYHAVNDGASKNERWEVPYLIVGCGGHSPVEQMGALCSAPANGDSVGGGTSQPETPGSFAPVWPKGLDLPEDDSLVLVAYNDTHFGFLRLTIEAGPQLLTGEFFAVDPVGNTPQVRLGDSFQLDLQQHRIVPTEGLGASA